MYVAGFGASWQRSLCHSLQGSELYAAFCSQPQIPAIAGIVSNENQAMQVTIPVRQMTLTINKCCALSQYILL